MVNPAPGDPPFYVEPDGMQSNVIVNGLVSYLAAHENFTPFIMQELDLETEEVTPPRMLNVYRGPRSDKFIMRVAPCIVVNLLRIRPLYDASSDVELKIRYFFQLEFAALGNDPWEADATALDMNDAGYGALRGNGTYFGNPTGRVVESNIEDSGFTAQTRSNPKMAIWAINFFADVMV